MVTNLPAPEAQCGSLFFGVLVVVVVAVVVVVVVVVVGAGAQGCCTYIHSLKLLIEDVSHIKYLSHHSVIHLMMLYNTKLCHTINGSKPCKEPIWRSSPCQSQSGWTSYPLTNGCKLALNPRKPPGNTEKRERIFSHFSSGSFFGSNFPAPSYVSLHRWLQGSPHCQACCPGWP